MLRQPRIDVGCQTDIVTTRVLFTSKDVDVTLWLGHTPRRVQWPCRSIDRFTPVVFGTRRAACAFSHTCWSRRMARTQTCVPVGHPPSLNAPGGAATAGQPSKSAHCGSPSRSCERSERLAKAGVPTGIRTRVLALKGPRPRPLDDGDPRGRSNQTTLTENALAADYAGSSA